MNCLWCDKELRGEGQHENLCSDCQQISTGVPGLSPEQLDTLPFGVIQLNRAGEIISFNQAEERLARRSRNNVAGRNFFADVAPCADVKDFHGRFNDFLDGDEMSEMFNYTYYFGTHTVEVQITFLRVNQQLAFVLSRRVEK